MASREAGLAAAVIGTLGIVTAACLTSGAYRGLCPDSICRAGAPATTTRDNGQRQEAPATAGAVKPPEQNRGPAATPTATRKTRPPDACADGYVWREAFAGDHVCVTPATRDQARRDNAAAKERRSPNGGAYGPDTCISGYVWRGANDADHVCVTPDIRDQTARDNELAASRRAHD
jgi:hypothetical protein